MLVKIKKLPMKYYRFPHHDARVVIHFRPLSGPICRCYRRDFILRHRGCLSLYFAHTLSLSAIATIFFSFLSLMPHAAALTRTIAGSGEGDIGHIDYKRRRWPLYKIFYASATRYLPATLCIEVKICRMSKRCFSGPIYGFDFPEILPLLPPGHAVDGLRWHVALQLHHAHFCA